MPIQYHKSSKTFHLYNQKISYIFQVLKNGQLGQLYYGKRVVDKEDYGYLLEMMPRPMSPCVYEGDGIFSMEHIKQEYPSYGHGDMRYPAFELLQENGSTITEFVYQSHQIVEGKPQLEGLPATYVEEDKEAVTLQIILEDKVIGAKIQLQYTIYEEYPVITRSTYFENQGEQVLMLNRAHSVNIDLADCKYEMIELTGAWSRERTIKVRKLEHGIQGIYSMRGCSSANYNPFLALKRTETTENQGEVYGFSFIYSGNFLAQVEVDTYDVTRVSMGIHPDTFRWPLKKGEHFQTPEAVMVYSDEGLNGMSQVYHKLYQSRLARGTWRDRERPILINSWEATYFDITEEKLLHMAKTAKDLGIEVFVLDDGWFGKRVDDTSSLGDWYPNLEKLPNGVTGLSKKIEEIGMKFGIWVEPEMVNKESELYRKHPDWILSTPNRTDSPGRNQFVLDLSKPEVVDEIYRQLELLLEIGSISYLKWDMNRSMTEVFSKGRPAKEQGMIFHRYILGLYQLLDRLTKRFPNVLLESCASGGSRFDPGMLYYAPQCWTSDDTDAVERLKIQYGTSLVYPISSIGAHVSASPNHQILRRTSLEMRGAVAYFGTFGYELDINEISKEEREKVKKQVVFMKKHRKLIQYGRFYRLLSPFEGNRTAWMVVSDDKKKAIVGTYRILRGVNGSFVRLKLQGLEPDWTYQMQGIEGYYSGAELMYAGMVISDSSSGETREPYKEQNGDFSGKVYVLEACF